MSTMASPITSLTLVYSTVYSRRRSNINILQLHWQAIWLSRRQWNKMKLIISAGAFALCHRRSQQTYDCSYTATSWQHWLEPVLLRDLCWHEQFQRPEKEPISTIVAWQMRSVLTHWGRVTHICVSDLTTIGSDNGLSPGRRQAIIWTNAGILLIRPLGTNSSEILIEIHIFPFKIYILKGRLQNGVYFISASMR